MKKNILGKSGIKVSKLCFGTLTLSESQSNKTPQQGAELIAYALDKGVNFLDTAQLYGTYSHIKEALKIARNRPIISTKTYAYNAKEAKKSVEMALREMDVDYIDIFMLHEQENILTMQGHKEAFEYLLSMKEKGIIKAVGISTHAVEPLQAIVKAKGQEITGKVFDRVLEFDVDIYKYVDVVHPIFNIEGLGILDGNKDMMENAIKDLYNCDTGIFGMKMFGGGNLLNSFEKAADYALNFDYIHSIAVGMQSIREIDTNIMLFEGNSSSKEDIDYAKQKTRRLVIDDWCTGCKNCEIVCKSKSIKVIEGKAQVDESTCVLCSYCAKVCKEFAIKVV